MAGDRHGFALIEVLVAGTIAAMGLAVVFGTGLDSLAGSAGARRAAEALAIARSRLAIAAAPPGGLAPAEAHGRDGAFDWRSRVAPDGTAAASTSLADWVRHPGAGAATLYRIEVVVSWHAGRGGRVALDTKRLGFAPLGGAGP